MKPINFPECNQEIFPDEDKSYSPDVAAVKAINVFTNGEQCISCWRLTFFERLQVFLLGRVWLHILTGSSQPPVTIQTENPFLFRGNK